jgi:thiamine biosynthesis lipoprotein
VDIAAPPNRAAVHRFSHEAMATFFEVRTGHPDAGYAAQAAQAAFALVDRLEAELSRFISNSDIGRVNTLLPGKETRVALTTMECLVIARHMFELTGGAFDVSIGTGLASLELDVHACVVRATRPGVRIDLGGIGKGYAVDLVGELLEEWGLEASLAHGGFSSVLVLDPPAGQGGWPLTLSDPAVPSRVLAHLSARQLALAASGLRKGDHITDPRTGAPVRGRRAAWVALPRPPREQSQAAGAQGARLAPSAVADALTTAFMLLGEREIASLCERSPGLEAWLLPDTEPGADAPADLVHLGG